MCFLKAKSPPRSMKFPSLVWFGFPSGRGAERSADNLPPLVSVLFSMVVLVVVVVGVGVVAAQ